MRAGEKVDRLDGKEANRGPWSIALQGSGSTAPPALVRFWGALHLSYQKHPAKTSINVCGVEGFGCVNQLNVMARIASLAVRQHMQCNVYLVSAFDESQRQINLIVSRMATQAQQAKPSD
ncbi:hypothetical protein PG989_015636 [Apiospora arundinis]